MHDSTGFKLHAKPLSRRDVPWRQNEYKSLTFFAELNEWLYTYLQVSYKMKIENMTCIYVHRLSYVPNVIISSEILSRQL